MFAAGNGYVDNVDVERIRQYEEGLLNFLETRHSGVLTGIREKKALDDELKAQLTAAVEEFSKEFAARTAAA